MEGQIFAERCKQINAIERRQTESDQPQKEARVVAQCRRSGNNQREPYLVPSQDLLSAQLVLYVSIREHRSCRTMWNWGSVPLGWLDHRIVHACRLIKALYKRARVCTRFREDTQTETRFLRTFTLTSRIIAILCVSLVRLIESTSRYWRCFTWEQ